MEAALQILLTLTSSLMSVTTNIATVSNIIKQAQLEGRTTLTPTEQAQLDALDDAARQALVDQIKAALAK